ncbi:ubiquitin-conjugating enzyme E2 [Streptomyces xanthophaeus]
MSAAQKRIEKELQDITQDPPPNISAKLKNEGETHAWIATLTGPEESPHAGGSFHLDIRLPIDYPFKAPKVTFSTRIFHPNVSTGGHVALSILNDAWSPALTVEKVLLSVSSLLSDPNPNDPLNQEAAKLFTQDHAAYDEIAREWTRKYATP